MTRTMLTGFAALTSLVAACTDAQPERKPVDGLEIEESTPEHVSGRFGDGATAIDFSLDTLPDGRLLTVTDEQGEPLIEAKLAGEIETITYMGRFTLTGGRGETAPVTSGDDTAMADFQNRAESKLIGPMREAFAEKMDRGLFAAPLPEKGAEQNWNATQLECGQGIWIPTYSWWWSVELITMTYANMPRAYYRINDGLITYYENVHGWRSRFGPWSWWNIKVTNLCSGGYSPLYVNSTLL